MSNHIIISGTGRAGTTLLVQIFTALGKDTGFKEIKSNIFENCNAGMETPLTKPGAPYIVKDPRICDYLETAITKHKKIIDHAIVPVRELYSAAQSRRDVQARTNYKTPGRNPPGGLWDTDREDDQESVLARKFYNLIFVLAKYEIPMTFLLFPRFAEDPTYLYLKIKSLLGDVDYEDFLVAFNLVIQPELIHSYTQSS
jgi:hypothetical protein